MAGPEAGHAFPAFALATRLCDAGFRPTVFTGDRWHSAAARQGIEVAALPELAARTDEDDEDAGAKLSTRAARMADALAPELTAAGIDLVISDVITRAGGWAAELCGLPWLELSPHPLYAPSAGLPPIGAGLAAGRDLRGRWRDRTLRALTAPALRRGERQRRAARLGIGLSAVDPGPVARLIATLPALEVYRPDWPADTHLVGPLLWEPTRRLFEPPAGPGPLIVVAPSTAATGADLGEVAAEALTGQRLGFPVRVVHSGLTGPPPDHAPGRQDELLRHADAVVCGGGHGMLAKALCAGVPVVTVPGGGDQWELANRVARHGSGRLVRPVTADALAEAVTEVLGEPEYRRRAREASAGAEAVSDPVRVIAGVLGIPDVREECDHAADRVP